MLANELITDIILPLRPSDTGLQALNWMDEYKVEHLPIVNDTKYLGIISDVDIYSAENPSEPIGNHTLSLSNISINCNLPIFEVIKIIALHKLSLIPVVDDANNYLGTITQKRIISFFAEIIAVQNPGGIIILEINVNDYSLSEIAQIVESNDTKILSLFIKSYPDSTKLEVIIKTNKIDINPVLQTFNRYNYIVKASFTEDNYNDILQNRFDSLMNYLNI